MASNKAIERVKNDIDSITQALESVKNCAEQLIADEKSAKAMDVVEALFSLKSAVNNLETTFGMAANDFASRLENQEVWMANRIAQMEARLTEKLDKIEEKVSNQNYIYYPIYQPQPLKWEGPIWQVPPVWTQPDTIKPWQRHQPGTIICEQPISDVQVTCQSNAQPGYPCNTNTLADSFSDLFSAIADGGAVVFRVE